jgi:hypothetical protein
MQRESSKFAPEKPLNIEVSKNHFHHAGKGKHRAL